MVSSCGLGLSQHDSWDLRENILRASVLRESGRGCMAFCEFTSEVRQHHFCYTLD